MLYYIMLLLQNPLFLGYIKTNIFLNPLSKDEEEKYIEQWILGDRNARDKLIGQVAFGHSVLSLQ